jgi:hypothetical protein
MFSQFEFESIKTQFTFSLLENAYQLKLQCFCHTSTEPVQLRQYDHVLN